MIEVQMCLYKTDTLLPLLLFGEYTEVVCITYTMATRDLPDIYALARGPQHGITNTYQANSSWPWYNY